MHVILKQTHTQIQVENMKNSFGVFISSVHHLHFFFLFFIKFCFHVVPFLKRRLCAIDRCLCCCRHRRQVPTSNFLFIY